MKIRTVSILSLAALVTGAAGARLLTVENSQPTVTETALKPKESQIASTGTAKVERAPEFVEIIVGVTMIEKSAGEAQAAAESAMGGAIKAVEKLGLAGAEFKSGRVSLSPRYEQRNYTEASTPKIVGYEASLTTRIKTTDLKQVSKIIDTALASGCNRVDSVEFGIKEALAAREEALALAAKAAKRKVAVLAEALDLKATRVLNVSSSGGSTGWWGGPQAQMANNIAYRGGAESSQDREGAIVPGAIEIWAEVNLTYAAEAK